MWNILKLWKQIWHQWVENSTPMVEFEPTISRLPTEFHWWSSCIRSSKQCISDMFIYKSGATNQEIVYENDKKIWIEDVRWRPFEFYDLGKNGVIYSLACGRNCFSTKIPIRMTNEVLFLEKCIQVFIEGSIHFFCPDWISGWWCTEFLLQLMAIDVYLSRVTVTLILDELIDR